MATSLQSHSPIASWHQDTATATTPCSERTMHGGLHAAGCITLQPAPCKNLILLVHCLASFSLWQAEMHRLNARCHEFKHLGGGNVAWRDSNNCCMALGRGCCDGVVLFLCHPPLDSPPSLQGFACMHPAAACQLHARTMAVCNSAVSCRC
jgi:hypothetical protein